MNPNTQSAAASGSMKECRTCAVSAPVRIPLGAVTLTGDLEIPEGADEEVRQTLAQADARFRGVKR